MAFTQSEVIDGGSIIESSIDVTPPVEPPKEPEDNSIPQKFQNDAGELNQDALLKAYRELEQKQGQGTPEVNAPEVQTPEVKTEGVSYGTAIDGILTQAGLTPAQLNTEYTESGKLSDTTYAALEQAGINKATVDAYTKGIVSQQGGSVSTEVGELLTEVYNSVGGESAYAKMADWAAQGLSSAEQASYDLQVNSGNPEVVKLAVSQLQAKYVKENGTADPTFISGGNSSVTKDTFMTLQDAAQAMGKARASGNIQAIIECEQKMLRSSYAT